MNELDLLSEFRAEHAEPDPRARAAAWRALEARLEVEMAAAGSLLGDEGARGAADRAGAAGGADRTRAALPRPRRSRRRGLLALAGVGMAAAAVAAAILIGSGSTAPPAAAEVLHQTADVAAGRGPAPTTPGPGQFSYVKVKTLELQGWVPGGPTSGGGALKHPRSAFNAVVPTVTESWVGPDGGGRYRQVMGSPHFIPASDRARWRKAGSPLPGPFDPKTQREYESFRSPPHVLQARRGVWDIEQPPLKDFKSSRAAGTPSLKGLPTHPEALRRTIERNESAGLEPNPDKGHHLDTEETIEGLFELLTNPNATPALRAATFNALAEMPGIELRTDVTDIAGRTGDAIAYDEAEHGTRHEYVFDPETSEILDLRWVLLHPDRFSTDEDLPAGTVLRDTAFVKSAIVGSIRER